MRPRLLHGYLSLQTIGCPPPQRFLAGSIPAEVAKFYRYGTNCQDARPSASMEKLYLLRDDFEHEISADSEAVVGPAE
jgi:hypothetical protein